MVDSTDLRTTPDKPRRRSYRTGEGLPELTDSFRPIQLGRDSVGNPDSQIRAFATAILNRSDRPIYVKEGEESDEIKIDRFESYDIWESNGISRVYLRGENGGEEAVVRTLEAHNDFSITDKIDAFIRGISHFLQSSKQETIITGAETEIDIGSVSGGLTVDSITTDITVDSITQGITVDTGTISVDSLPNVTVGTINDGISVEGTVNADVAGNVTVDDITAASAEFDGDITGQTNFDLTAATREGRRSIETADYEGVSIGNFDQSLGATVAEFYNYVARSNATYDGRIERIEVRLYDDGGTPVGKVGFNAAIDSGSGYETVSPRATARAELAFEFSSESADVFTPNYYPEAGEAVLVWEPSNPPTFSAGDSVGIEVGPFGTTAGTGDISMEAEIILTDIVKE